MGMELGRPLLETLIAVVDHDKPEFSPEFFAGLSLADRSCLQTAGILLDGEPYESMWVETAHGHVEASVVVDPYTNEITLYHPEDGPTAMSPDAVRRQVVDGDRFASWVMHALFKMPKTRKPIAIVPQCIWDLGTPRLGKKAGVQVILVRRLYDPTIREKLAAELLLASSNQRVVVLTTTANARTGLSIPRVTAIVTFGDIIRRDDDHSGIDLERLGMFVERGSTTTLGPRKPVDCAPDGSWLRIHDREYKFRAGKKDIILMLFKTWECGDEWVPVSRLLEDYGVGTRLEDVFKDGRAERKGEWREFMEVHERRARLIVPPA